MSDKKAPSESEIGTGEETVVEQVVSNYMATGIHLFLSVVALLLLLAAVVATYDTVVRAFPMLWQPQDEYAALQKIVENLLLIAIAAEFALLLLFHRMSAAVEVVVFIMERKNRQPADHGARPAALRRRHRRAYRAAILLFTGKDDVNICGRFRCREMPAKIFENKSSGKKGVWVIIEKKYWRIF